MLDVNRLQRVGRGIRLTPAGQLLAARAAEIISSPASREPMST
jgi:DNA-binding transcriptional LysR family regulator